MAKNSKYDRYVWLCDASNDIFVTDTDGSSNPIQFANSPHMSDEEFDLQLAACEGGVTHVVVYTPFPESGEPVQSRPIPLKVWRRIGRPMWIEDVPAVWIDAAPTNKLDPDK